MFDVLSNIIIIGITGLSFLLYECLIKNHVSTKGNRAFFYFILVLHLLVFLNISFPYELKFMGDLTILSLGKLDTFTTTNESSIWSFETITLPIYFVGIAIGGLKMTLGISKVIRRILKSSPGKSKFERFVSASNFTPCTFFNYILIPPNLPRAIYNSVYKHEKYHADQMHTIDMILWSILSILFWFNPFVHLLKSRQSQNLEYDTDQHLIKSIPKGEYSEHLLSATFKSNTIDFYPMLDGSNIYRRIKRLNEGQERKGHRSGMTLAFTFILLLGGTILSKASFLRAKENNVTSYISKPEFRPNGHETYIDSVLQAKIEDKFDHIDRGYRLYLFLDITIDKEGKVIKVHENDGKSRKGSDLSTNNFLSELLNKTIKNMPRWIPAMENGISVESTIQEEFLFSGESE